ncbi:MAG TPA: PDZ domain-containing protein [Terracidiphilus sp.]|nr:PDZ domain-containing protein [Terracidiphilus sp.]
MGAHRAAAQSSGLAQMMDEPNAILRSSSQGYMGVLVGDVDSDSAAKLKLKEVRGALITLIDHDAPAAQAGIRVNDVVVQVNGQPVEGAEQFTRMMREIPAGRSVSLLISRDGNLQTIGVQLVDRKKMEHDAWNRLDNGGDPAASAPGMGILGGGGGDIPSGGFHMPFVGTSTLNVGAMVEPLTSQMAEYLGIQSGLMIKQVARKSEAEKAGLKAFDVILKVGADSIATTADWDRALRANQDKPVAVTVLRDRRQQTVTLQVDAKRHRSELDEIFPFGEGDCPLIASLDPNIADALAQEIVGDDSALQSMRDQAEALRDPLRAGLLSISPEQAEQFRKQAEEAAKEFREQFNGQALPFDQKQMDEWKRQMEQFQKQFKAQDFKFDQKQFDQELKPQLQHEMDQLKRQLEEMQAQGFDLFATAVRSSPANAGQLNPLSTNLAMVASCMFDVPS